MDELLALIEAEEDTSPQEHGSLEELDERGDKDPSEPRNEKLALSVDDRIGIRMLNRKMCGADLFSLISDVPYHPPANLAAMSLAKRNKLLVSPATVIDVASVTGRTNIVTVGIVFSSSGTRISSSGNGFCAVTIGTLATGPTVSVLLFGSAYGKHVKACKPGKVVALVGPKLIPPKPSGRNDMAISFVVSTPEEVVQVADARDFAFCKGTVSAKNEKGQWVSNARRCSNFVDKRVCDYCLTHKKRTAADRSQHKQNGMQQIRAQPTLFPSVTSGGRATKTPGAKVFQAPISQSNPSSRFGSSASSRTLDKMQLTVKSIKNTKTTPKSSGTISRQAAFNQRQGNGHSSGTLGAAVSSVKPTSQVANMPKRAAHAGREASKRALGSASGILLKHDWLEEATVGRRKDQKGKTMGSRKVVNTDTLNFDGSVSIPKPSKIFSQSRNPYASVRKEASPIGPSMKIEKKSQEVLAKQRQVADNLKAQKENSGKKFSGSINGQSSKVGSKEVGKSLFTFSGSFAGVNTSGVLEAKSRFSAEYDAEKYARSRRAVTELEETEGKADARKMKKDQATQMQKEWHCRTCQRIFQYKPTSCVQQRHSVSVKRKLLNTKTVTEKRLALADTKVSNGGMVLGSGLEWSKAKWSRFS